MSELLSKEEILTILNSDKIKLLFHTYNIKSVLLFGSINTDEFSEASDVDLAIISDKKLSLDTVLTMELELQKALNREIDIINLNSDNLDLFVKVNILNTGILLHTFDDNITLNKFYNLVDRFYNENENYLYFRRLDVLS